jgi:hypothetical protein
MTGSPRWASVAVAAEPARRGILSVGGTRRIVSVITAATALWTLSTVPPAGAATEIPVLTTPAGEFQPARGTNHLAWERNTKAQPQHYDVFASPDGGPATRVNRGRSNAAMGGIDGDRLVYQRYRKGRSNLAFFDLATGKPSSPLKAINTRNWEYWPSISDPWLLFGRLYANRARRLILYNLDSGHGLVLDKTHADKAFIGPGQVNGDFAVWSKCPAGGTCQVYRHHIPTQSTVQLPSPGSHERAPSVTSDGTVYLSRGGCATSVRLVRVNTDGSEATILDLPPGWDVRDTYAYTPPNQNAEVYFQRSFCGSDTRSDIFKVQDAEAPASPPLGSITIWKDAIPDTSEDFEFRLSSDLFGTDFTLDDDPDPSRPNQIQFRALDPGTYTVREIDPGGGWELTGIGCTGGGPNTSSAGDTATIGLDPGEAVTCTFTNTKN